MELVGRLSPLLRRLALNDRVFAVVLNGLHILRFVILLFVLINASLVLLQVVTE